MTGVASVLTPKPARPLFSIIVPAYNEEDYLPKCLDAIGQASAQLAESVEVIVVDNASTDRTAAIAHQRVARVVHEPAKRLSVIRNRGAAAATGRYLAFIDADSYMSNNALVEVRKVMASGKYIGGGVANVRPDRFSLGMLCSGLLFALLAIGRIKTSCVMFYTTPEAFHAIGGFNEDLVSVEDVDFGARLRDLGRARGLRYKNLWRARVTTSARKLDEFGDWFLIRHPSIIIKAFNNDPETAHRLWYKPRR